MSTAREQLEAMGIAMAREQHAQYAKIVEQVRKHHPVEDEWDEMPRRLDDANREWENTVAAASLLGYVAGLRKTAEHAYDAGAISAQTAVELVAGIQVYALLGADGGREGFVAIAGDDAYTTSWTVQNREEKQPDLETVTVMRLGMPGVEDAETLSGIVRPDGPGWTHDGFTASARIIDFGDADEPMMGLYGMVGMEWWPRYADMVRPLAMSIPQREFSRDTRMGESYAALPALRHDGGFRGWTCAARTEEISRLVAVDALRWAAPRVMRAQAVMAKNCFQWPQALLQYGDLDRYAFSVLSPSGDKVGVWHRNIDLFVGRNEHMVVVELADNGEPERIMVYPTWQTRDLEDDEADEDDDDIEMGTECHFADENSVPMRPSRGTISRIIEEGGELPAPAFGMNLLTGELLSEQNFDAMSMMDNMIYGVSENFFATVRIEQGEMPGYVLNSKAFDEEGDEPREPGVLPRP